MQTTQPFALVRSLKSTSGIPAGSPTATLLPQQTRMLILQCSCMRHVPCIGNMRPCLLLCMSHLLVMYNRNHTCLVSSHFSVLVERLVSVVVKCVVKDQQVMVKFVVKDQHSEYRLPTAHNLNIKRNYMEVSWKKIATCHGAMAEHTRNPMNRTSKIYNTIVL
jgi:hypothetical protein